MKKTGVLAIAGLALAGLSKRRSGPGAAQPMC
jgi:hypothetical protein